MLNRLKKKKPHKTRAGRICLTLAAHNIDTVIDIGANKGQTRDSLRAWGYKGEIISVEPLAELQADLQKIAAKDPEWTVLPPLAVGWKNGTIEINISEASDMSSVLPYTPALQKALPRTASKGSAEVEMKTLDSLYESLNASHSLDNKNVFVKLDTQGSEMAILEASPKTLEKIRGLQVEMSLFELYESEVTYDRILTLLREAGFVPYMIFDTYFSRKLGRQLQIDGVFYKNRD